MLEHVGLVTNGYLQASQARDVTESVDHFTVRIIADAKDGELLQLSTKQLVWDLEHAEFGDVQTFQRVVRTKAI